MSRPLVFAASLLPLVVSGAAIGADRVFNPELRPSYGNHWAHSADDALRFEAGVRYWYSRGAQDFTVGGLSESAEGASHAAEAHFRIEDDYTQSFLKGNLGYAFKVDGTYSSNGGPEITMEGGKLGYIGADFGWLPFGELRQGFAVGPMFGYQYTYEAPDTGRANFTTASSLADITWSDATGLWAVGFDSEPNSIDVHALRLGVAARAELGEMVDLTAEIAAIPYAWVSGTYGGHAVPLLTMPDYSIIKGSATTIDGTGYGGSGEIALGLHPTENLTFRIGGRASYIGGKYDATWEEATIFHPELRPQIPDPDNPGSFIDPDPLYDPPTIVRQGFISTANPFSMVRYGAFLEVTGRF